MLRITWPFPAVHLADGEGAVSLPVFWQSLHVLSDLLIGVCYVAIALTLLAFIARAGRALPFRWLFVAFGAFIVSCGWTHFMHVAVVADGRNWVWLGAAQAVTVVASGATALLLPWKVPGIVRFTASARRSEEHAATMRKQAELLELATDAIIVRDAANRVTFWNEAAIRIYGWSREDAIGQILPTFLQATYPNGMTWNSVEAILQSEGHWEGEIVQSTRDGRRIVVLSHKALQRAEDGTAIAIMEINTDITVRKLAEAHLQESEERYRTVLAALDEGVVLQGTDGAIIAANASAERILGLHEMELVGQTSGNPHWEAIHEDGTPYARETHPAARALQTGEAQTDVVMGLPHTDAAMKWLSVNARPLFQSDEDRPYGVVVSFRDITERKIAEERLQHAALHDPLTGLANRTLFMDRLTHAFERNRRAHNAHFAVIFVDFDRFKNVNDDLGHQAGDALLVETARRLRETMRASDTVARLGGDEFAVVVEDLPRAEDLAPLAERLQQALHLPFLLTSQPLSLTVSIGIAHSAPSYTHIGELLRDADTALYRAKAEGRSCIVTYDATMHEHAITHIRLEQDLRRALEKEEFTIVYQPIVALATGTPVAFEALVRWHHPEYGLMLPGEFIPILEEIGYVPRLDEWMIRQTCRQLAQWQELFPALPPLAMSVNLSSQHFRNPALASFISGVVTASGIAPAQLRLEITERLLLEPTPLTTHLLSKLQMLGVQVQIDDFGMGYSSLIYLHRFPFNTLKLDREFLSGTSEANAQIMRTVMMLAHTLKLEVIAEGIERADQVQRLLEIGCDWGQGYHFAYPMTAHEIVGYLRECLSDDRFPHTSRRERDYRERTA